MRHGLQCTYPNHNLNIAFFEFHVKTGQNSPESRKSGQNQDKTPVKPDENIQNKSIFSIIIYSVNFDYFSYFAKFRYFIKNHRAFFCNFAENESATYLALEYLHRICYCHKCVRVLQGLCLRCISKKIKSSIYANLIQGGLFCEGDYART